jgi:hypothetical protein
MAIDESGEKNAAARIASLLAEGRDSCPDCRNAAPVASHPSSLDHTEGALVGRSAVRRLEQAMVPRPR